MSLELDSPMAEKAGVRGTWRNIRWLPNPSTGELLNLGVLFVAADGSPHVRLLDHFDRLTCMYDSRLASDAKFLIEVTRDALLAGISPPANNVVLSEPKFASGHSIHEVMSMLFETTVPLGTPKDQPNSARGQSPSENTSSVRQFVLDELRKISGPNAGRIISSEKTMQVNDGNRVYHLDIPLQTRKALGTIVSARTGKTTTELTLHKADTDLQIARKVYGTDKLFMYVVRPAVASNIERVDSLLDEFTWKFKRLGVQMKTYADAELVAPDIVEDMPV